MTKLSIPHEFVQRNVLPNKHLTTESNTESLRRMDSTSSLDSARRTAIGRLIISIIFNINRFCFY